MGVTFFGGFGIIRDHEVAGDDMKGRSGKSLYLVKRNYITGVAHTLKVYSRREGVRFSAFVPAVLAALMSLCNLAGIAQSVPQPSGGITIEGTVRDATGQSITGALVRLEQDGGVAETTTNAEGVFTFAALANGRYTLTAEKSGFRSAATAVSAVSQDDRKHVDLILAASGMDSRHTAEEPSAVSSPAAMEFSDKPNFTVAGVTDWTAVGGHGSDSSLRTSEDLTRQTLALKAEGHGENAAGFADGVKKDADAHRLAGEQDESRGDPLAAVHEFEQAARLDPSERNYFAWGSELLLHRAVWQARQVFQKGAEAHPKSARMLTALGTALFAGALYDEAARRLCDASDLNPADSEPYIFMGKIEIAAPNPLACVEQKLARFVELQPGNARANYFYAMAILKRQQQSPDDRNLHRAEALLTKAVSLDAKCGDAYLQLGILSSSQRRPEEAIGFYRKAIEAEPQLGDAHYRLAVAYDRIGEHEKAKQEFQLHDEIEKREADAIDQQRREVKQFLVVLPGESPAPTPH
jgi:tetratricopeptide (TPR) repeat protein